MEIVLVLAFGLIVIFWLMRDASKRHKAVMEDMEKLKTEYKKTCRIIDGVMNEKRHAGGNYEG